MKENSRDRRLRGIRQVTIGIACGFLTLSGSLLAQTAFQADAVIAVDTSRSMANPGMDAERTSLLVSKLFSDLVPGRLAVIRLLDLDADKDLIPSTPTTKSGPCDEDPTQTCTSVTVRADALDKIREGRAGALIRPERGSATFKKELNAHLEQKSNNSMFHFSFAAALGVFEKNEKDLPDVPRSVIWLADGRVPGGNAAVSRSMLDRLKQKGVDVLPIVFGNGDTAFAKGAGLEPHVAKGAAQLVEAFTDAFRRIMKAPYKIHGSVAGQPAFEMKPQIEEAWIVFYGDETLSLAEVETPSGVIQANYAQDSFGKAGAYRVAHMAKPAAGNYRVRAKDGGSVSYGVVQRSDIAPVIVGPPEARSGKSFTLVVALRAAGGPDIPASSFGEPVTMVAEVDGQTYTMNDEGKDGDEKANDGRYGATLTLAGSGIKPVRVTAKNSFLDRSAEGSIKISGLFRYNGPGVPVNLGAWKAGEARCAEVRVDAIQEGTVGFALRAVQQLPDGYSWQLRKGGQAQPGSSPVFFDPEEPKVICLATNRSAASFSGSNINIVDLDAVGAPNPDSHVPLLVTWDVRGLSWWERWGWLIITLAIVLFISFVAYGYIRPKRFPREMALSFAPTYPDLDDQIPQPVRTWRDVRVRFYRNARLYLHPDFRITGKNPKGAIAWLEASTKRSATAKPISGFTLFRETADGDWESVPSAGRRAHNGDVYRIGDTGPFFRISARLGR